MGAQVNIEPEVKIDVCLLKAAMAEFVEFAGTGGFVLIFSIGYNYGKLIVNKELPDRVLEVKEILDVIKKWSRVYIKTIKGGKVLMVKSKDPFTVGFICGCLYKIVNDFKIDYEDNRALVHLSLKEEVVKRSKTFSIFSFSL